MLYSFIYLFTLQEVQRLAGNGNGLASFALHLLDNESRLKTVALLPTLVDFVRSTVERLNFLISSAEFANTTLEAVSSERGIPSRGGVRRETLPQLIARLHGREEGERFAALVRSFLKAWKSAADLVGEYQVCAAGEEGQFFSLFVLFYLFSYLFFYLLIEYVHIYLLFIYLLCVCIRCAPALSRQARRASFSPFVFIYLFVRLFMKRGSCLSHNGSAVCGPAARCF